MNKTTKINEIIAKNLIILRKNKKLTQLELAEKFNYSDKSISKWETGESLPSLDVLLDLCKFYDVSINSLIDENYELNNQQTIKKTFPAKLIISLLGTSAVWLLATILFVAINIINHEIYWMAFLWALPISCLVLTIFNVIWGKRRYSFFILTILLWSSLACVHIQLIKYNLWIIYIIGIPLQVAIILWHELVK